ncbi:MAG: sensor histidine kinase [Prolixibacteraceae bacterium]|jgi:sensor histidine kinase YesM|nr:sensor histidine kinase [Prolixibacteraceae bacterium]
MKISKYKNQMVILMHLLFWMLSINCWNIVFNPGVETTGAIKGLQDYWFDLFLLNALFFFYCCIPFVWYAKRAAKWLKIGLSVLFLVPLFYVLFEYLQPSKNRDDISFFTDFFLSGFMYVVVFHLTIALAVYYNLNVLVCKYLKNSKFWIYILTVLILVIVASVLNFILFDYVFDTMFPELFFVSYYELWELLIIVGSYLILTTGAYLVWQYAVVLIANRNKAQNELSALKAQINPHFLFNNLNTIYSMAVQKDEKTKDVILQLSDFLRYVLYDTSSNFIPLEKEVEIIRTYVELQKARLNPEISTVILTTEGNFTSQQIAPLLLLPLAENCFKHGTGRDNGVIQIHIGLKGKQLHFTTENPVAPREKSVEAELEGIGINNVEKRLNLIYPDRYSLQFGEKEGVFSVEMKIEL